MVKTVFAEENILYYLKNLSTLNVCSTGLILGQSTEVNDYVVLLVRTPEQSEKEIDLVSPSPATFQCVKEIRESWIADHAKHVIKMLPGGIGVLGAFVCSPNDIFNEKSSESKAKSILHFLKKQFSSEPLLHAECSSSEKLLLHFNIVDFKYSCKTLDINNPASSFKSVDWKFQNNYTKWCQIDCSFDLNQPSFGGNMACPVKDQLKNALLDVNQNLKKALVVLNNELKNPDDLLEVFLKKGNQNKSGNNKDELPALKAIIFMPFQKRDSSNVDIVVKECDVELHFLGVLASQVFLSQKSTVAEAINAVKQDVVRSLTARFEMHWDSIVEEEYGSPEEKMSIHEPPRRVSVLLPNSKISFNDYLFPGEGASEVISSFKEMLDITISEENLEKEIEKQGDPMELYGKPSLSTVSSKELLGSPLPKGLLLILFTIGIMLLAIAVALFFQKNSTLKKN